MVFNQFDHVSDLLIDPFLRFPFFLIILFIIYIAREKRDLRVYTFHAYTLADSPFA